MPLNLISVAFAVLFIGIAVDFSIQFSVRYRSERFDIDDLAEALRRTARGIGGPLAVAAATTAVGFFSFVPTAYTGVSDLGLISGVGMLIALALNLTVLPALLVLIRPRGERLAVGFHRLRRRRPLSGRASPARRPGGARGGAVRRRAGAPPHLRFQSAQPQGSPHRVRRRRCST